MKYPNLWVLKTHFDYATGWVGFVTHTQVCATGRGGVKDT